MNIVPLSNENIEETIALANSIFPHDVASNNPPEAGLRKSLESVLGQKSWRSSTKGKEFSRLNYWVMLDDETKRVVGFTGLYAFADAPHEVWLGWFGLDASTRGKGLGRELLEWTMNTAREEGYTLFKLYTTTDPLETAAQKLYDSCGLKVVREEHEVGDEYTTIYREGRL